MIRSYPLGSIVPLDLFVPSAWVKHREDESSRGILLGHRAHEHDTVLWSKAPFFETIRIVSTQIKAVSRKLSVKWHVVEESDAAFLNEASVHGMAAC